MQEALRRFCLQHGMNKTYYLAYSGGMDSHVLLSLMAGLRQTLPLQLRVIHINHGLSPHAAQWAVHCAAVCRDFQLDFIEHVLQLDPAKGDSLEAFAREKRYAVFANYLKEDDVLLTAHHQQDQAETVLLQLLRGAGIKGLAAMPPHKPFAKGIHARPLLDFSRQALHDYAKEQALEWIEDESNQCVDLNRNYLRHHILPALQQRWPSAVQTLSRSARHCAEAQALLEESILSDYQHVKDSQSPSLSLSALLALSPARQRLVLRCWIQSQGYALPSSSKMEAIQQCVLPAASDRFPQVQWGEVSLRRYRDDLYLVPSSQVTEGKQVSWQLDMPCELPGVGVLRAEVVMGKGLRLETPLVRLGFRVGGESIRLAGRGTRTLKKLFQEWGVPVWLRDSIPLLYVGDSLVSVAGYAVDEAWEARPGELGWEVYFSSPNTLSPVRERENKGREG